MKQFKQIKKQIHLPYMNKQFESQAKDEGYQSISTGGHGEAYHKKLLKDWYVMLTDDSGMGLPTSFKKPIIIGIYHNDLNVEGFNIDGSPFLPTKYNSFEEINKVIQEFLKAKKI